MRFCCIDKGISKSIKKQRGQATVEAAFIIPVAFIVLLALIQPGVILYDKMIMNAASAHMMRIATTLNPDDYQEAIDVGKHYLKAIPDTPIFHDGEWVISLEGNESEGCTSVEIIHKIQLFPLVAQAGNALGVVQGDIYEMKSQATLCRQQWLIENNLGLEPSAWIKRWEEAV